MKIILMSLILFSILSSGAKGQVGLHDSVFIVASSPSFDYRNPVVSEQSYSYFPWSDPIWLAYERHTGNASDLIVRSLGYSSYGTEIVLSANLGGMNINPAYSRNMIVWQSNSRGSWDLYYSYVTGDSTWSAPILLDSSGADETEPCILNNQTGPAQYNFAYVVFKRDNTIRFKRYRTLTATWDNDTLVIDSPAQISLPLIFKDVGSAGYQICFLRKDTEGDFKLNVCPFTESLQGNPVQFGTTFQMYSSGPVNDIRRSMEYSPYLTIPFDTLGEKHLVGMRYVAQSYKEIFTRNIPGKHITGKGAPNLIPTDNPFFLFSTLTSLTRSSDSIFFVYVYKPNPFNTNPVYSKVYAGDTSFLPDFDVSGILVYLGQYRVKTIRERMSGGRIELVESFLQDLMNNIETNSVFANGFALHQNSPNPFNPETRIDYVLPEACSVSIKVFDLLGREVATLLNMKQNAGGQSIYFNGAQLPSGIYIYRLNAGSTILTRTMALIK
jgi:hypothetical protein